jgi:hypothetical protein
MRKILFGVTITLAIILAINYFYEKNAKTKVLRESSVLIRDQISNVGKLIVTEGHFSEVYRYEDSKKMFGNLVTAEKKALVVVNANVDIAYDLSKMKFEIDSLNNILRILSIPETEIKISPDLEYYDVKQDYLNPFSADDYNLIKDNINTILNKKIEGSSLKKNAKNRLLSELSKFFILTNSLGWQLEYQSMPINELSELEQIKD